MIFSMKLWTAFISTVFFSSTFFYPVTAYSQILFHSTRIKAEYQYSDYFEYAYPDPIYFEYPDVQYTQLKPYIAEFPEHRFLFRIIQNFDYRTALNIKYQFSDLDIDSRQNLYAANIARDINDQLTVSLGAQYTDIQNELTGWMYEGGFRYDFAGFTMVQPHFYYYSNKDVSFAANKSSAYSYSLLVRQAVNEITALQLKYTHFNSKGTRTTFNSNTLTGWYSRYFYTETALHLSFRYHWNSEKVKAYSPEIEVVHYLNWASIVRLMYRYYESKQDNTANTVIPIKRVSISSHAAACVLEYLLFPRVTVFAKYRFYISNQNVKMNTYLLGIERLF